MLFNIFVSKFLYDAVTFGSGAKELINILRVSTILWGLALVTFSVFYFLDWTYSETYAKDVWKRLSMN